MCSCSLFIFAATRFHLGGRFCKESALLLLSFQTKSFISKSPGGYTIYRRDARVLEMQNFPSAYMRGGRIYGLTDDFL